MPQNELTEPAPISAAAVTKPIPAEALRTPRPERVDVAAMIAGGILGVVVLAAAVAYLVVLA